MEEENVCDSVGAGEDKAMRSSDSFILDGNRRARSGTAGMEAGD